MSRNCIEQAIYQVKSTASSKSNRTKKFRSTAVMRKNPIIDNEGSKLCTPCLLSRVAQIDDVRHHTPLRFPFPSRGLTSDSPAEDVTICTEMFIAIINSGSSISSLNDLVVAGCCCTSTCLLPLGNRIKRILHHHIPRRTNGETCSIKSGRFAYAQSKL